VIGDRAGAVVVGVLVTVLVAGVVTGVVRDTEDLYPQ